MVQLIDFYQVCADGKYSGGNDPAIIFPDIDIPSVAKKIAQAAFFNTGQVSPFS